MELTPEEAALVLRHRAEQAEKQAAAWKPRPRESYADAEKCAAFDALYRQARTHFEKTLADGYADEDADHYIYEAVMELLGKDVWKAYNAAVK